MNDKLKDILQKMEDVKKLENYINILAKKDYNTNKEKKDGKFK